LARLAGGEQLGGPAVVRCLLHGQTHRRRADPRGHLPDRGQRGRGHPFPWDVPGQRFLHVRGCPDVRHQLGRHGGSGILQDYQVHLRHHRGHVMVLVRAGGGQVPHHYRGGRHPAGFRLCVSGPAHRPGTSRLGVAGGGVSVGAFVHGRAGVFPGRRHAGGRAVRVGLRGVGGGCVVPLVRGGFPRANNRSPRLAAGRPVPTGSARWAQALRAAYRRERTGASLRTRTSIRGSSMSSRENSLAAAAGALSTSASPATNRASRR